MADRVETSSEAPSGQRAQAERQQRLAAVGALTRTFVHDLNNLLGSVSGAAHLLALKNRDPAIRERIAVITEAANRAIALAQAFATLGDPGMARVDIDGHDLLRRLASARVVPAPMVIEAGAAHARIQGDPQVVADAIAAFATTIASQPGFSGSVRLVTANRGRAFAHDKGDAQAVNPAWWRIALHGDGASLPDARRRIIEAPLSVDPGDFAGILLAAAVSGISRCHGLVQAGGDDGAVLCVHLPTVGAPTP
jgi:hypothetical protein